MESNPFALVTFLIIVTKYLSRSNRKDMFCVGKDMLVGVACGYGDRNMKLCLHSDGGKQKWDSKQATCCKATPGDLLLPTSLQPLKELQRLKTASAGGD